MAIRLSTIYGTRIGIASQQFTSSGTFIVPNNIKQNADGNYYVYVTGIGGGAGGGAEINGTNFSTPGAGPSYSGDMAIRRRISVVPNESISITIGSGGSGGSLTIDTSSQQDNSNNGQNGASTSFGNKLTLNGGGTGSRGSALSFGIHGKNNTFISGDPTTIEGVVVTGMGGGVLAGIDNQWEDEGFYNSYTNGQVTGVAVWDGSDDHFVWYGGVGLDGATASGGVSTSSTSGQSAAGNSGGGGGGATTHYSTDNIFTADSGNGGSGYIKVEWFE